MKYRPAVEINLVQEDFRLKKRIHVDVVLAHQWEVVLKQEAADVAILILDDMVDQDGDGSDLVLLQCDIEGGNGELLSV